MSEHLLHTAVVRARSAEPSKAFLFLHGILGSGGNLRGLAQALVLADPLLEGVLVDLRMHGRSQRAPAPHDVQACADDLTELAAHRSLPIRGVVGHSFGGKVALAFHATHPDLERVVLLDSYPGIRPDRAGSEETMAVLDMLARLPAQYEKREQFIERVQSAGHSRAIADWLAMNLERSDSGFTLRIDLAAIHALLDSYFSLDLWSVLERSDALVDVVIGGRSRVWDAADRERLRALSLKKAGRLRMHVLPDAGHWVHVDAPQELRALLTTT
jgi:esterase